MKNKTHLNDITIRIELKPGDIGYIIYLHGILYSKEFGHGVAFESYVAKGLHEFYKNYNPKRERVWICEHENKIIGSLLLQDKGDSAQLRDYVIRPEFRGIGLGKKLMGLYVDFMKECSYKHSFLWTTNELKTASHLYKMFGFKLAEEKETTTFGKLVTEQRYDLNL